MIQSIQAKYRKASKEANKRKKVSPDQERLKSKTKKKFNAEDHDEGRRGDHGGRRRGDKARTAQKIKYTDLTEKQNKKYLMPEMADFIEPDQQRNSMRQQMDPNQYRTQDDIEKFRGSVGGSA